MSSRLAIIYKFDNSVCWQGFGETQTLMMHAGESVKRLTFPEGNFAVPIKTKTSNWLSNSTYGKLSYRYTCTYTLTCIFNNADHSTICRSRRLERNIYK